MHVTYVYTKLTDSAHSHTRVQVGCSYVENNRQTQTLGNIDAPVHNLHQLSEDLRVRRYVRDFRNMRNQRGEVEL